jgi:hypothetical protein
MKQKDDQDKNLVQGFIQQFRRLSELRSRFRPGRPFEWKQHHYTKRPMAQRKAEHRRKNKAARIARRRNRRK